MNQTKAMKILTGRDPLRVISVPPIQPGSWPRTEILERSGEVLRRRWSSYLELKLAVNQNMGVVGRKGKEWSSHIQAPSNNLDNAYLLCPFFSKSPFGSGNSSMPFDIFSTEIMVVLFWSSDV